LISGLRQPFLRKQATSLGEVLSVKEIQTLPMR